MRATAAVVAIASLFLSGAASAGATDADLQQTVPLVVPALGNATLVHVTFELRAPPAGAAPHVFVVHGEQLAKSMLVVGAAKITRSGATLTYDALLGLLRRRGPPDSTGGRGLALGFRVSGANQVDVAAFAHATAVSVLGAGGPASLCRAVTGIAAQPTTSGVVGAQVSDAGELAKATAALCSGRPGQINTVLARVGPGTLGVPPHVAAALRILQPQRERGLDGGVAVFMDPRVLPAGTTITEAVTHRPIAKLKRAGRLFWEDLGHTILTPHASKVLILDARTLKAALVRPLLFYPLVRGAPPPFHRTPDALIRAPDAVYLRLGPNGEAGLVQYAPIRRTARLDLANDALVTIGDRHDAQFLQSFTELEKLFGKGGLNIDTTAVDVTKVPAGKTATVVLKDAIDAVADKKKDIFIFVAGHGYAEHGSSYVDKDGKKIENAVVSKNPQVILDEGKQEFLGGPGLESIIKAHPKVTFKIVIESCFSGRFLDMLKAQPNVAIAITSAPKNEPSHTGFDWSLYTGLQAWAGAAGGPSPPDLVGGLQAAFGVIQQHAGNDHPQIYVKNPATGPKIDEDDTWTHNPPLGKSNVCINVRTTPKQAQFTVTLTGPDGYKASTPAKQPLKDGAGQFIGVITKAGLFTKTITVYDAKGTQTGTAIHAFLVADPPTNGKEATPPCPKPDK